MAGIGFSLQRLLSQDRLSSNVHGCVHATLIAAGPWLFTCLALAWMQSMAKGFVGDSARMQFASVTVIAFSLSLVVAGPLALVLSRCLADAIHAKQVDGVTSMMFKSLAWVWGLLAPIGLLLFGWVLDLPVPDRVLGFALLLIAGGLWVVAAMMSALRSYTTVSGAFALGLLVGSTVAYFTLRPLQGTGLLMGLVVGLVLTFFALAARLLAEFPAGATATPFGVRQALRQHQGLAWAGLFYSAAIWVDKWIMWMAPSADSAGRGLWTNADYEGAMFHAFLTIVPLMVLLLIDIETRFHVSFQRYQRGIMNQGTLRDIRRNHGALLRITTESLHRLVLLQAVLALVVVVATPAIMNVLGGSEAMASTFRFGVIGAAFHGMLIVMLAALAYFDQQRWMVIATGLFLLLNAALTLAGLQGGPSFDGWGYATASLLGFAVALYGTAQTLVGLPYVTFIAGNQAIRKQPKAHVTPLPRPRSVLSRGAPSA